MEVKRRLVEPFYFPGSSVGCLLVHGFTGSPSEMRFLGERLRESGWTVLGIRLSGHGTTPEEMEKTRWEDWARDAETGVLRLRESCQTVIGIGLSMGGLISLHLAAKGLLDGVVALNAPIVLQDWRIRFAALYKPFVRYVNKPAAQQAEGNSSLPGTTVTSETEEERFVYGRVPVACLDSLNKGIDRVRRELDRIRCPVLLMQSEKDQTVDPASVRIIAQKITQTRAEVVYWPNSGHILTLGPERAEVAEQIREFVHKLAL